MPIHQGSNFFQWGNHGKKYKFKVGSESSKQRAYMKAKRQMKAIKANEGSGLIGRTVGSMVIEKGIKETGDAVAKAKDFVKHLRGGYDSGGDRFLRSKTSGGDGFIPDPVKKKSPGANYGFFSKHLKDRADKHWWAGPVAEALHAVGLGEKNQSHFVKSRLPPPIMSNDSSNLDFASKNRLLNATAAR